MNILLVALNSKYSHTNLAVRYLKDFADEVKGASTSLLEFTINQSDDYILWEIFEQQPEVVCFSCYIWNIERILILTEFIKKSNPAMMIVLGGPEVTYESDLLLLEHPSVDIIIRGEGEITFKELVSRLATGTSYTKMEGISYRIEDKIAVNPDSHQSVNMEDLSYPYKEEDFQNKYIYYESSRGCPFNCSFCMSSCNKGVKNLPMSRIKEDITRLLRMNAKTIKFVDRTFNYDAKRAMEIIQYIVKHNHRNIKIHLELTAELIDEPMLQLIGHLPKGMFQFEIGVQSTHQPTLNAVTRKSNFGKLEGIVRRITSYRNVHLHVDLIAGLPLESYDIFGQSFNDVYRLEADKIQLGFLKVLKGTKIREEASFYGLEYKRNAPYEIVKTGAISYLELLRLKRIEILVESYYNERYFHETLKSIMLSVKPFEFFDALASYWTVHHLYDISHKRIELYQYLYDFVKECGWQNITHELLDDFIFSNKNYDIPKYLYTSEEKKLLPYKHHVLKKRDDFAEYFIDYEHLNNKKLLNEFRILEVDGNYFMYVYGHKDEVFERCKKYKITKLIEGVENELPR
ncbi:MAG: B12-binding domain-containing radical SAM protein [Tissierellales bacterium]|nr:B12-binding domain-containing radical SAM protein [Tissierellales bacterium]MBN2827475.1 B12-binding domain-containing radical SAM protein [Tissierellales bacterium]